MKLTHILQIALACVVAGGGAAVPLLVSPMTPTAWLLLAIAEAGALGKVLSVQSEVAGDAPVAKLDAVTKAASKVLPLACLALCIVCLPAAACHETPQAAIVQTIDLTDAVCSVAPDLPVDGPLITLVCQLVEGTEGIVQVAINALDDAGAADGGSVTTALVPVRTVTIQVARADAARFLAAHKGKGH